MKKQLLSLLCAIALFPAFSTNAQSDAIVEKWRTPQLASMKDDWGGKTINWNDPTKILPGVNPRFATAKDGKIYTVNQQTMAIAEVTAGGLKDVYVLPKPSDPTTFYGTAISMDEAGNFLIGENFTERPNSSLKWAVYSPSANAVKHFQLTAPSGLNIGRVDCVGRVLGDLTKEAYFFIAPEANYSPEVLIVKASGSGSVTSVNLEIVNHIAVEGNHTQQNIAQPRHNTLAEALEAYGEEDFYYSSCNPNNRYYARYADGELTSNFAPDMLYTSLAETNGFATFQVDGEQYFIRNYGTDRTINIVIMDANGDAVATWLYPSFEPGKGGYSSIIAEPLADKTVNVYVYNCNGTNGSAAMLNFDPAKAGEPVKPEIPVGNEANPYVISTPEDITAFATVAKDSKIFYAELANDIDMFDVAFAPIASGATIHLDGKNHVIKNLNVTLSGAGNAGLFETFVGSIENLGLEDIYVYTYWGVGGAFAGTSGVCSVKNCFATGTVIAAAAGGFFGSNTGSNTITDSYTTVEVKDINAHFAGGIIGRADGPVSISYSYAGGKVTSASANGAKGAAAGLVGVRNASDVILNNVIAWNPVVSGLNAEPFVYAANDESLVYEEENAYIYSGMLLNGDEVGGPDDLAAVQAIATSWPAFNKTLNDGYAVLAWQDANGATERTIYGTIDNPYVITNANEFLTMANKIETPEFYVELANDIDLTNVKFSPMSLGVPVHFDGKQHVIKNLVATGASAAVFNNFTGTIKNLGLDNAQVDNTPNSWGVGGILIGYSVGEATVENCFITGSVSGFYAGGLAAGVQSNATLTIKNCYTSVSATAINNGYAGGLVGAVNPNATLNIENSYAYGVVSGGHTTGGITVGLNPGHPGGSKATFNFDNVVAWNSFVSNDNGNPSYPVIAPVERQSIDSNNPGSITNIISANNVVYWDQMMVNDEAVEGGVSEEELIKTVTGWEAFSDTLLDGMPALLWQVGGSTGITDIEIDDTVSNEAPVYYNLQGVQVANPENGIYIVRRGNKVTKELVR